MSEPTDLNRVCSRRGVWALVACISLGMGYAVVAWAAVSGKSPTDDEVNHVFTAWFDRYRGDFSISPDVPPLWEYWIALPMGKDAIWSDGTHGDLWMVRRARMMCLLLAVALAGLIGWWAYKLGGPLAAIVAMFFYCADPHMLGHGALAKNDMASALFYCAAAYAVWKLGGALTWSSLRLVALAVAGAVAVKFSGLILAPVVAVTLILRALLPPPWTIFDRCVSGGTEKLAAAGGVSLIVLVFTYLFLWGCYQFRYQADPYGGWMQISDYAGRLRTAQLPRDPTPAERDAWRPPLLARTILFANDHHLIPQAMAAGLLLTEAEDQGTRPGYLLGTNYQGGKWDYFPLAFLFKTPLATLLAIVSAALIATRSHRRQVWTAVCLCVPSAVYGLTALSAQLNLGLRHIFPIYPFIFIAVGVGLSWWCVNRRRAIWLAILAGGLMTESVLAYPNYIAFFNAAFASHRLALLSDSNLDWGQDLPLLAEWQQKHPDTVLYVDYEGACDPAMFGIRYINLPDGRGGGPVPQLPTKPGVLAIGATVLQERLYPDPVKLRRLGLRRGTKPLAILGQTIYLFRFDGTAAQ